mmetsp:Transcript_117864/g.380391  ORF Transcript_117864/g.380391 Transcript_117864/m.380391 type:complete len:252 (-) Transcript_117864:1255-2010(-)
MRYANPWASRKRLRLLPRPMVRRLALGYKLFGCAWRCDGGIAQPPLQGMPRHCCGATSPGVVQAAQEAALARTGPRAARRPAPQLPHLSGSGLLGVCEGAPAPPHVHLQQQALPQQGGRGDVLGGRLLLSASAGTRRGGDGDVDGPPSSAVHDEPPAAPLLGAGTGDATVWCALASRCRSIAFSRRNAAASASKAAVAAASGASLCTAWPAPRGSGLGVKPEDSSAQPATWKALSVRRSAGPASTSCSLAL